MNTTVHLLKQLETYPTFTIQTIEHLIQKNQTYTKVYLNRLKKRHLIQQLQRNVYTVQHDPLIIASRIIWPSYISLWTALRYHNLTDQTPHTISVLTTRAKNKKHITIHNTPIIFERIKPLYFFGFAKTRINDFEVFIAEPEKALIDAALLKRISLTEIYSLLKQNQKTLSTKKLTTYILRTHNTALVKRFGWMFTTLGYTPTKNLEKIIYKTMIPLDYAKEPKGPGNTQWGVIENIEEYP